MFLHFYDRGGGRGTIGAAEEVCGCIRAGFEGEFCRLAGCADAEFQGYAVAVSDCE